MALSFLALLAIQVALTVLSSLLAPRPKLENATADDQKPSRSEEGAPIPVVFGTTRVAANVTDLASTYARPITVPVRTGLFTSKDQTTGFTYELVMQAVICHGPIDELLDVVMDNTRSMNTLDDRTVYGQVNEGGNLSFGPTTASLPRALPEMPLDRPGDGLPTWMSMDAPNLFQGKRSGGGISGEMYFYWGTEEQGVDEALRQIRSTPEIPFDIRLPGVSYAVFGAWDQLNDRPDRFNFGEQSQLHEIHFLVRRCPSNLGLSEELTNIGGGANPAEMIWEILTNYVWGLGIPEDALDRASFVECAGELAGEGMGLNMILGEMAQADETIREIMRYIDGQLQHDPITGLLELSLNRGDYDVEALPLLDESVLGEVSFTRPSWQALKNEVKVMWSKREGPIIREVPTQPVQDLASQRTFGQVASETVSFLAISDAVVANQLALRTLRMVATPLGKLSFKVNRSAADFKVGRVFRFTYPAFDLTERIYRVASIDYGTLESGQIDVEAIEDVFSLDDPFYFQPEDSFEPPSTPDVGTTPIRVEEVVTATDVLGTLQLNVTDPEGHLLRVEFTTQAGNDTPSGWFANQDTEAYRASVVRVPGFPSVIAWRILGMVEGEGEVVLLSGEEVFAAQGRAIPQAMIRMLPLLAGEDPNSRARFEISAQGPGLVTLLYRTYAGEAFNEAPTNPYTLVLDRPAGEVTAREILVRAEADTGEFDEAGPVIWDWDTMPGVRMPAPTPLLDLGTGLQTGWEQTASVDDDTRGLLIQVTGDLGSAVGEDIALQSLGGGEFWANTTTQKTLTLSLLQSPGRRGTLTLTPYRNSSAASRGVAGPPMAQRLERAPLTTYSWNSSESGQMLHLRVDPADAEILYRILPSTAWITVPGPVASVPVPLSGTVESRVVEFYSRVPGGGPSEQKRTVRLDRDSDPFFDNLSVAEIANNLVAVEFVGADEDCVRWAVWARRGSMPVGDAGAPDQRFLKDEGPMERKPRRFYAVNGEWYFIGRAYNARGAYHEVRVPDPDVPTTPLTVDGSTEGVAELSNLDVALIGASHRVTWQHNNEVDGDSRVVVLEHVGGATREIVTLGAARSPATDPSGSDTESGEGGVNVPIQLGTTFRQFVYEVQIFDGTTHLRSYQASISGSNYAGDGQGTPPPSGAPVHLSIEQDGDFPGRLWFRYKNTDTHPVEFEVQWQSGGSWKRWELFSYYGGQEEFFIPFASLPTGSQMRAYARYMRPTGAGMWSAPSNVITPT